MDGDRERWNAKWRERAGELESPAAFVVEHADLVPARGRALDLAGGAGRHAIWLARCGLAVTLCDISRAALDIARRAAGDLAIRTIELDLDQADPPAGPWDVILCFHYLNRGLIERMPDLVAPNGHVFLCHPTRRNLERHEHPSSRFLVAEGELRGLLQGLTIVSYEESWGEEGRHEARAIARRIGA